MAEYLRLVDGQLQTAVHHYVHPETGRRITLVGTRHFADPSYWSQLSALINGLVAGGAVVQSEGARLLTDDDADGTAEEQKVIAERRRGDELELNRLADLGWVHQLDGLAEVPHLQIVDLSYLQIIRRAGPEALQKAAQARERLQDIPDDKLRFAVVMVTRFRSNDRAITGKKAGADDVLIRERDEVALDGVSNVTADTVMVRGVAHMPGIGAGLRELGFVRSREIEWVTAASQISIRSAYSTFRRQRKTGSPPQPAQPHS